MEILSHDVQPYFGTPLVPVKGANPAPQKAFIILNPSSGKEKGLDYARTAELALLNKGYAVEIHETEGELDAARFSESACKQGCELVVCMGGDGTLNETINGLMRHNRRPKLGIVPLGTVNDFARALGIPLEPAAAIAALDSEHTRAVDIGLLNDRLFSNVVAVGTMAEALAGVTPEEKSRLGSLSYIKEGLKELVNGQSSPLRIKFDRGEWEGACPLFVAALTNSVGGFEKLAPEAEVDDGLIHGFIFKDLGVLGTLTAGWSLWFGSLKEHKDVVYFTTRNLLIESSETVRTNIDGEPGPDLPASLRILPGQVRVVVPEAAQ